MAEAAAAGRVDGFLAYDNGGPVGWCRAAPRGRYRDTHSGIRATDPGDDESTLAVVCFVIAAEHRRCGVARRLLESACEHAWRRGFDAVEGYALKEVPIEPGLPAEAELFRGPRGLFDKLGFEVAGENDRYWIMRLVRASE
jgi:GNAT superfamily N-acetyltransferase